MRSEKGFSLVEAMVTVLLIGMIMGSVFMMILHFRDVYTSEQSRVRQTQETRFLYTAFTTDLMNAGSILTLANTGSFLSKNSFFTGIFPLNSTNYSDGVIVATGDPNAVSKLTSPVVAGGATLLLVDRTTGDPGWQPNDRGIILSNEGYYVFSVVMAGGNSLTIDSTPVYYSGLLNCPIIERKNGSTYNYTISDPAASIASGGKEGNLISYPVNAPVIRLGSFSIYLMNVRYDANKRRDIRELVRVVDTNGAPNPLTSAGADKSTIAENIYDLQIVYTVYPAFPLLTNPIYYGTTGTGSKSLTTANTKELLDYMNQKLFKEITVNVVVTTDDYAGKGLPPVDFVIAAHADESLYTMPKAKYTYKQFDLLVNPKNFGVAI